MGVGSLGRRADLYFKSEPREYHIFKLFKVERSLYLPYATYIRDNPNYERILHAQPRSLGNGFRSRKGVPHNGAACIFSPFSFSCRNLKHGRTRSRALHRYKDVNIFLTGKNYRRPNLTHIFSYQTDSTEGGNNPKKRPRYILILPEPYLCKALHF